MSKEFKRQDSMRHLRLGKKRKSLRKWRRPKGRDSKMRLKRRNYPSSVSIGYRTQRKESGKINGLYPVVVHNAKELLSLNKNSIAILGKIGAKKKIELLKLAQEKNIKLLNVGGKNETGK